MDSSIINLEFEIESKYSKLFGEIINKTFDKDKWIREFEDLGKNWYFVFYHMQQEENILFNKNKVNVIIKTYRMPHPSFFPEYSSALARVIKHLYNCKVEYDSEDFEGKQEFILRNKKFIPKNNVYYLNKEKINASSIIADEWQSRPIKKEDVCIDFEGKARDKMLTFKCSITGLIFPNELRSNLGEEPINKYLVHFPNKQIVLPKKLMEVVRNKSYLANETDRWIFVKVPHLLGSKFMWYNKLTGEISFWE